MPLLFSDNKNQESTSESVNGYYGVYLFGLAIGNDQLRDLGRLLLATGIDLFLFETCYGNEIILVIYLFDYVIDCFCTIQRFVRLKNIGK
jgi:hypothetical protein